MVYRAKCMVCRRHADGEKINDAVLGIQHHEDCDEKKGIAVHIDIWDLKYGEN